MNPLLTAMMFYLPSILLLALQHKSYPISANSGPRWTDTLLMFVNILSHEYGHVIGFDHPDKNALLDCCHYDIMHTEPRWEPGTTHPKLPEIVITKAESFLGIPPSRSPGSEPTSQTFYLDIQYVVWRILEEWNPLKIR